MPRRDSQDAEDRRGRSAPSAEPARPPKRWPRWLPFAGVAALALLVRAIYLVELHGAPGFSVLVGDARQYDAWAREVAGGEWIGTRVFYQTPLYPYLLGVIYAVAGPSVLAVRVVQGLLGAASAVLLALAGRRFFDVPTALLAGGLLAVYAPAIFFDGLIQKASLDLLLMTLVLALAGEFHARRRWPWLAAAGLALGAFMLNRENARVLYPIVAGWLFVSYRDVPVGRRAAWAAVLTAAVLAVLLPVGLRNYYVGGEFLVSTSQMGPNFYIGNHTGASGVYEPLVPGRGDAEFERADATRLAEEAAGRQLSPGAVSRYWFARAVEDIRSHPIGWLRLMARKLALTFHAGEIVDTDSFTFHAQYSRLLAALSWFSFGVALPLAALGAWLTRREWRRLALLHAVLAGLAISVTLFFVVARYRYPMVPVVMLFAAAALARLPRLRTGGRREWAVGLLLLAAVGAASNLQRRIWSEENDAHFTVGLELATSGRGAEALPLLRRAVELSPGNAAAHYMLGVALEQTGTPQPALEAYLRAVTLRPEYAEAHHALGLALLKDGRTSAALQRLREAVRLKPDFAEAHVNLGLALWKAGRHDEARPHYEEAIRLKRDNATAHNSLAGALQEAGDLEGAIRHYREAVALNPAYAEAHSNLGLALASRGSVAEGIEQLEAARRIQPSNAGILMNLGDLFMTAGRRAEGIARFEEAARLMPDSVDAHYVLAQAYAQDERLPEAVGCLERARALARSEGQAEAAADMDRTLGLLRAAIARRGVPARK